MVHCRADDAEPLVVTCTTCHADFVPVGDEFTDDYGKPTCDLCYCRRCGRGHLVPAACPLAEPDIESMDPDAVYDLLLDRELAMR